MQDLRLVLIILGFIAIVALIAHGLWSNKKNQVKPLKDKPLGKVDNNVKDRQGFDLDGIGEKRVVIKSVEPTINVIDTEKPTPVTADKIEPQFSSNNMQEENVITGSFSATDIDEPIAASPLTADDVIMNDVSYDVVEAAAPSIVEPIVHNDTVVTHQVQNVPNDIAANDTNDESNVNDPAAKTETNAPVDDTVNEDEAVFVINIMAREGKNIAGAELLQELSAFGFKFGAMNIFHRHVDAAGKGPVIFSLANMVKPGVFDIDTMEQFESPGVSLFMMFPCAGQASHNYSLMLSAAERIAEGVDGLLMDASRNPLLEDAIEQEQAFIRKLENKALAKKPH
ncbi:cell division protein ZipA [Moritella sp. 24]|uniref:cell division protein ZipA n=1 Tax=Moritella sp. 24 TaxID=2746230 RepID=UPI001BA712E1|nr:cell division protein ZipA [Moritella sp. 24]QUM75829.1 cell division protein ZipA [Moritella sp. 24]